MKKLILFLLVSLNVFAYNINQYAPKSGRILKEDNTIVNQADIMRNMEYTTFKLRVATFQIPGYSWIDKFGKNPDLDTADQPEEIWELGGEYPWGNDLGETLYVSSSDDLDNQEIEFSCLTIDGNGNWNKETFTQVINGQTKTALIPPSGNPVVRCNRMESLANFGDDILGIVYAYYDTTVSSGTPDDITKVLSAIVNGSNQTKQLTYTVPTGYVGFLMRGEAGIGRGSGTDQVDMAYKSRRFGKVFKSKKDFTLMTSGNSTYKDERMVWDPVPSRTDLSVQSTLVTGNNMTSWGTFDILLIEEDYLSDAFLAIIGQVKRVD